MALFKAVITNELARDEDKLAEQLYIFLNEFVRTRLIYEPQENIEDCIQDTIMFILKRYRDLSEEDKDTLNLEKYFYNRANSYVSRTWLRKKRIYDRNIKNLLETAQYTYSTTDNFQDIELERESIDLDLLNEILDNLNLSEDITTYLRKRVIYVLIKDFNYDHEVIPEVTPIKSYDKFIEQIIFEYALKSLKEI
jgi:hypothetical protein